MDYVTHVLFTLPWERCKNLDDYFAGWETDDEDVNLVATKEGCERTFRVRVHTANIGCQTPTEWLSLEPQERGVGQGGRAEPRGTA